MVSTWCCLQNDPRAFRDTERRLRGYRTLPRAMDKSPSGGPVRRRRFFSPPWARPRARRQFFPDTHLVSQSHARQFLDPPRLVFPNFPPSPRIFSWTLLHSSRGGDDSTVGACVARSIHLLFRLILKVAVEALRYESGCGGRCCWAFLDPILDTILDKAEK